MSEFKKGDLVGIKHSKRTGHVMWAFSIFVKVRMIDTHQKFLFATWQLKLI